MYRPTRTCYSSIDYLEKNMFKTIKKFSYRGPQTHKKSTNSYVHKQFPKHEGPIPDRGRKVPSPRAAEDSGMSSFVWEKKEVYTV